MSIFEELRQRVSDYDSALTIQLRLLTKSIADLVSGFGDYLGLPSPTWHHSDGKAGDHYVRLGVGTAQQFQEKTWLELSSFGGKVDFSLALTIDPQSSMIGRQTIVFEFGARFVPKGYEFQIKGFDKPLILSPDDVKEKNYEVVYQALVARLESMYDSRKVEIVS